MMSSSELAEHFALIPAVRAGPLRFGAQVSEYAHLLRPVEIEEAERLRDGLEYDEYSIIGLEEALVVYVDTAGRIDSVSFYDFCVVAGRNLIDMGVGQMMVVLGAPDDIEAEEIGGDLELLYAYDALGLTIWTVDGRVCVVQGTSPGPV